MIINDGCRQYCPTIFWSLGELDLDTYKYTGLDHVLFCSEATYHQFNETLYCPLNISKK